MSLEIRAINLKLSCLCIYTVHVHVCGTWILCVEGALIDIHSHISGACMLARGTFTPSPPFHPSARWPCSWHTIACTRRLCSQSKPGFLYLLLLLLLLFSSPSSSSSLSSPPPSPPLLPPGQSEKAQPSDQDISQTLASGNHHVDGATEPGKRKRRKKSELTLSFACTMCDLNSRRVILLDTVPYTYMIHDYRTNTTG